MGSGFVGLIPLFHLCLKYGFDSENIYYIYPGLIEIVLNMQY